MWGAGVVSASPAGPLPHLAAEGAQPLPDLAAAGVTGALTAATSAPGQWGSLLSWPSVAVHSQLLPTGKVLFFGDNKENGIPHIWDPATNQVSHPPRPGYNIHCVGQSLLPDGRVLLTGGHIASHIGYTHNIIYDPFLDSWTRLPEMREGRWYPTQVALGNGDIVTVAGEVNLDRNNLVPEIWQVGGGGYKQLPGASYDQSYYPELFLQPDGRIFKSGPEAETGYIDPAGDGSWTTLGNTASGRFREKGTAVMYDAGKILIVGGDEPPTATAEVIDLNDPSPAWRFVPSMNQPRRQHQATILAEDQHRRPHARTVGSRHRDVDASGRRDRPALAPRLGPAAPRRARPDRRRRPNAERPSLFPTLPLGRPASDHLGGAGLGGLGADDLRRHARRGRHRRRDPHPLGVLDPHPQHRPAH